MKGRLCFSLMLAAAVLALGGCSGRGSGKDEKVTLVMATFQNSANLEERVRAFNESNDRYQIEVKRYSLSTREKENGLETMKRDIATGVGPDLVNFGMDYSDYSVMGDYLVDLYGLMEADGDFHPEDYYENIFHAFEYEGHLYAVPPAFMIQSMIGKRDVAGEYEDGWTVEEMLACYSSSGAKSLLRYATKMNVFSTIVSNSMNDYVDWKAGECHFNEDAFKKLITFANTYPEQLTQNELMAAPPEQQALMEGDLLVSSAAIGNVYDVSCETRGFGEDKVFYVGYPVADGVGNLLFTVDMMLGISELCEHKDAAWSFVKSCLEEEYQYTLRSVMGLPVHRAALERQLEEAQEITYTTDASGERAPVEKASGFYDDGERFPIYNITPGEAETLRGIVENADKMGTYDRNLGKIIIEEVQAYFAGDRPLESTVDVIQRRAYIYVNERME